MTVHVPPFEITEDRRPPAIVAALHRDRARCSDQVALRMIEIRLDVLATLDPTCSVTNTYMERVDELTRLEWSTSKGGF